MLSASTTDDFEVSRPVAPGTNISRSTSTNWRTRYDDYINNNPQYQAIHSHQAANSLFQSLLGNSSFKTQFSRYEDTKLKLNPALQSVVNNLIWTMCTAVSENPGSAAALQTCFHAAAELCKHERPLEIMCQYNNLVQARAVLKEAFSNNEEKAIVCPLPPPAVEVVEVVEVLERAPVKTSPAPKLVMKRNSASETVPINNLPKDKPVVPDMFPCTQKFASNPKKNDGWGICLPCWITTDLEKYPAHNKKRDTKTTSAHTYVCTLEQSKSFWLSLAQLPEEERNKIYQECEDKKNMKVRAKKRRRDNDGDQEYDIEDDE